MGDFRWIAGISGILLTAFVLAVSVFDLRHRRIPNFLVFPAAATGLILNLYGRGWAGLGFGMKGLATGFLLLFLPYLVGGMKAGDVKFLAAIGAFTGSADVIRILLATVLFYPLMAFIAIFRAGKWNVTWLRFRRVLYGFLGFFLPGMRLFALRLDGQDDKTVTSVKTPFGVSIAAGTLIAIYTGFLR